MSMTLDKPETPNPTELTQPLAEFPPRNDFERFLQHAETLMEPDPHTSLRAWTDLAEAWRITQVLAECNGNRSAAARRLGIGRRTLYAKMDKLGITPSWNF